MNELLQEIRNKNIAEKIKCNNDKTYVPKQFEIVGGKIVEVAEGEGQTFAADPSAASATLQKKYMGQTSDTWQPPTDYEGDAPEGYEIVSMFRKNPFTGENIEYTDILPIE